MCKEAEKVLINSASRDDDTTILKALLAAGTIDIDAHCEDHDTALLSAVHSEEKFLLILEAGADPNIRSIYNEKETALVRVVEQGLDKCTRAVLNSPKYMSGTKKEDSVLTDEEIAVFYASQHDNHEVLKALVEKGINLNSMSEDFEPPVIMATSKVKGTNLHLLLKSGADPNKRFKEDGYTALQTGVINGSTDLVQALIKHGAEINVSNFSGDSPLTEAAKRQNREDILEVLLKAGANPDFENEYGVTALMLASANGSIGVVEILLENGANINHQGKQGDTALMFAAQNGNVVVVEELLEKGADAILKNKKRLTALRLAKKNRHPEVVALLQN